MKDSKAVLMAAAVVVFLPLLLVVVIVALVSQQSTCGQQGGTGPGVGSLAAGGIPAEYVPLIRAAGQQCVEFPPPVIAAQLKAESGFNPTAVSVTRAEGIAQFEPETWPTWGGTGDPFNPADAIPAQAKFDCALSAQVNQAVQAGKLHLTVSVTEAALFGYNAGLGSVLASGNGAPTNAQSSGYVPEIMGFAKGQFSQAGTISGAAQAGAGAAAAAPGGSGASASGGCSGASAQVRVLALSYPGTTGPQAVDVYLPPGGGAGTTPLRPMIVMVHGGGSYFGDRHELDAVAKDAAMHGYLVINGEYDMSAPRYPKELGDVRAEIAWARSQAAQWGGDPTKMATLGDSAGANLAVTVATTGDHAGLQAAVGWSGPYDLAALPSALTAAATDYQKAAAIADPAIYLGCLALICPATYTAVSPAVSATPGAAPTYLANSEAELVPLAQQVEMAATLQRLGVAHQTAVVPGTGHATAYAGAQTQPTLTWLDKTLGFTPPPTGGGPVQQAVVDAAKKQLGLAYIWGGGTANGPTGGGFDCSGLTLYAFHQAGSDVLHGARTAQSQYAATAGARLPGGFNPASYQPGDLLFYGTADNVHHVAIAIGGGQLIQASTFGEPLNIKAIYQSDFFGATRPLTATPGAPQ